MNWSPWAKSTRSNPNGECVQVRHNATHVQIGDTRNPGCKLVTMTRTAFAELLKRVKDDGEL